MRGPRIALAAGLLVAALPAMAQATAPLPAFTFAASPLIVSVGDVTDYTFTFTKVGPVGSQSIRCAEVLFPDELWISGVGTPTVSNNGSWSAAQQGQWIIAKVNGGGGSVHTGESVTFTVTALAASAGAFDFYNHVHSASECDDTNNYGTPAVLTVVPGIVPTPSPTATPRPSPTATPTATPKPTVVPTPGTPRPTPTATPGAATPTSTPTPTATPHASARPAPPSPAPRASSPPQVIQVAPLTDGGGSGGQADNVGVGVDVLTMVASPFDWILPGAPVALPGLLVILFVVLQAVGALAWIPAVRRLDEEDDDPRRRRRARPVSRGA